MDLDKIIGGISLSKDVFGLTLEENIELNKKAWINVYVDTIYSQLPENLQTLENKEKVIEYVTDKINQKAEEYKATL